MTQHQSPIDENQNGQAEQHTSGIEPQRTVVSSAPSPRRVLPTADLPFGYATMMMAENGHGLSRKGWSKPAFVHLKRGKLAPEKIEAPKEGEEPKEHLPRTSVNGLPLHLFEAIEEGNTESPVFMRTTQTDVTIYNPTHEDILAEDWYIVTP